MLEILLMALSLGAPAAARAQQAQPNHLALPMSRAARAVRPSVGLGGDASLGSAKSEPVGREIDLGRTPLQEEFNPLRQSVAVLPGGGFAVAWTEVTLTASTGVPYHAARLQYVTDSGAIALPAGGLLVAANYDPETFIFADNYPVVVVPHPTSGVFVAHGRGGGRPEQVLVQWVDGEGRTRWPGAGVSAFGPGNHEVEYVSPYLLPGDEGGVFVCSVRYRFVYGAQPPVVCQYLSPTGEPQWGATGIEAGGRAGYKVLPKAVRDGEGGLLVLWLNTRDSTDRRVDPILVEGQRFAPDGRLLWGPQGKLVRRLSLKETFRVGWHDVDAVTDGAGGAVVAFVDWNPRQPTFLQTHAQRVTRDGGLLWGRGVLVGAKRHHAELDALMAVGDGGAIVNTWSASDAGGPDHTWIQSYRLSASGQQVWGSGGLSLSDPGAKGFDFASFGQVDEGRLRAVWVHELGAFANLLDVQYAEITLEGERLVPAEGLPLTEQPRQKFLNGFAYDPVRRRGLAAYLDTPDPFTLDFGAWDAAATLYPPP